MDKRNTKPKLIVVLPKLKLRTKDQEIIWINGLNKSGESWTRMADRFLSYVLLYACSGCHLEFSCKMCLIQHQSHCTKKSIKFHKKERKSRDRRPRMIESNLGLCSDESQKNFMSFFELMSKDVKRPDSDCKRSFDFSGINVTPDMSVSWNQNINSCKEKKIFPILFSSQRTGESSNCGVFGTNDVPVENDDVMYHKHRTKAASVPLNTIDFSSILGRRLYKLIKFYTKSTNAIQSVDIFTKTRSLRITYKTITYNLSFPVEYNKQTQFTRTIILRVRNGIRSNTLSFPVSNTRHSNNIAWKKPPRRWLNLNKRSLKLCKKMKTCRIFVPKIDTVTRISSLYVRPLDRVPTNANRDIDRIFTNKSIFQMINSVFPVPKPGFSLNSSKGTSLYNPSTKITSLRNMSNSLKREMLKMKLTLSQCLLHEILHHNTAHSISSKSTTSDFSSNHNLKRPLEQLENVPLVGQDGGQRFNSNVIKVVNSPAKVPCYTQRHCRYPVQELRPLRECHRCVKRQLSFNDLDIKL